MIEPISTRSVRWRGWSILQTLKGRIMMKMNMKRKKIPPFRASATKNESVVVLSLFKTMVDMSPSIEIFSWSFSLQVFGTTRVCLFLRYELLQVQRAASPQVVLRWCEWGKFNDCSWISWNGILSSFITQPATSWWNVDLLRPTQQNAAHPP